ncbi:zinc finger, C2H2 type [Ancylostoma caninum]|uniref:Zinc finger, C2H2 type n=1 Tax=Ancylostoma caninum TaxID=29170 RepID=A0A368GSY2_ANCCA|nr:zinc finger, C2H2 type [Ancylostoma caninum]
MMSDENVTKDAILDDSLPNWALIDEVSIPLLESGLARFSTLQAVLPSIVAFDANSPEASQRSQKLLRISQLQIEYLLKSQHQLLQQISKLGDELRGRRREVKQLKANMLRDDASFFKCSPCGKVFVNEEFLASHLKRRHSDDKTAERSDYSTELLT